MRTQIFHLPDADGRFGTCGLDKICMRESPEKHDAACADKCHQRHQKIDVKGHGGKRYVLVDDHGTHVIIEDDLTPNDFDALAHIKANVAEDCADCMFEVWDEAEWAKEVKRLSRENAKINAANSDKPGSEHAPLLTQKDRGKPVGSVTK